MDTKTQKTLNATEVKPDDKSKWIKRYQSDEKAAEPPVPTDDSNADPFTKLLKAQSAWSDQNLSRNVTTVRESAASSKQAASNWLDTRIKQLNADIEDLKSRIGMPGSDTDKKEGHLLALPVVNEKGVVITDAEIAVNPGKNFSSRFARTKTDVCYRASRKESFGCRR